MLSRRPPASSPWRSSRTSRSGASPARSRPSASSSAAGAAGVVRSARRSPQGRSDVAGGIGFSLTVLTWLVLLAGVVTRGLAAERVPWGNMYEFGCAAMLVALTAYIVLVRVWAIDWVGPIITGFGTVVLGCRCWSTCPPGRWCRRCTRTGSSSTCSARSSPASRSSSARPRRRSTWSRRAPSAPPPEEDRVGFLWRIPTSAAIDQVAYRVHAFAFPIWTFAALIAGPIWAQYAWGRYWGWDPKEVWAFITWVVYAGYLHARATAGWKGKAAAVIALVGFATFVFNFVGVNLFVSGLHSYAK